ncbi:MAG: MBL fold metallo-hydrolase [Dissulfurimicrobium sp.]|uniref:MBL fold metallo-hydrolase n=1 Tax=Dissulfurimicrobium sp. TaxID=2022436 RepID=UPI00404B7975
MIELIVLGSGTCAPSIRRAGPAACLRAAGQTFLIDSAAGTLRQMARAGISHDSIDTILYTHLHPDHVGEFVPFVFAMQYAPGYRRISPVRILAARGFKSFYAAMKDAFGHWVEPEKGGLVVEELSCEMPSAIQSPPFIIRSAPVRHTPQSLAYRIECPDGKAIVFSGDTDMCQGIIELADGADILVCECAAPEEVKVEGHLVPSEAGRIAKEARVKMLLLTHFYPVCDEHDIMGPCKAAYDGPVILAEDLMRIVIK